MPLLIAIAIGERGSIKGAFKIFQCVAVAQKVRTMWVGLKRFHGLPISRHVNTIGVHRHHSQLISVE